MPLGGWSPLGEPVDALKLKEERRELMLTSETLFPSIAVGSLVLECSISHVAFKNERVCRDSDEQQYRILHGATVLLGFSQSPHFSVPRSAVH